MVGRLGLYGKAKHCVCYGISVRPSVCLSVRHTLVLCENEGTQRDAVFTIG